jgi:two-component system, cell cycle response regulator DivK
MVQRQGVQLIEAEDGLQGFTLALREQPDLILIDLNLCGISGLTLASRIKNRPEVAHIPVVILTADVSCSSRAQSLEAGCDGYLEKPFTPGQLLDVIRRFTIPC